MNEQLHNGKMALPYVAVTYMFRSVSRPSSGCCCKNSAKIQIARLRNFTNVHVLVYCISVNVCLLHGIGTY